MTHLVARTRCGTAARCLQWGGCVRALGMPGFTDAGVSSAPLERQRYRGNRDRDCMRPICTYEPLWRSRLSFVVEREWSSVRTREPRAVLRSIQA